MIDLIVNVLLFANVIDSSNKVSIDQYFDEKYEVLLEESFIPTALNDKEKSRVAHGGGRINGKDDYTNCYDAVKSSYEKGCRMIELDIGFTADDVPVMIHSWDGFFPKYFDTKSKNFTFAQANGVILYSDFINTKMKNNWTQLTLENTIGLMDTEFPQMYLITDTKEDNKKLLNLIDEKYNYMKPRIIPQVYNQDEYQYAKSLNFDKIIYTLYLTSDTPDQVVDFCKREHPYAITMSTEWAKTKLPAELEKLGVYTYVHTINDKKQYEDLKKKGIDGIYTDALFD